jgi:prepilin-type processing-associated H-X9-DG protein
LNGYFNCAGIPKLLALSDYAACATDQNFHDEPLADGTPDLKTGDDPTFWRSPAHRTTEFTGVIFLRSQIRMTDISNGSNNTYMMGAKHVNPIEYYTGKDQADGEAMLTGMDGCISRTTAFPPIRDTPYFSDHLHFGSGHPGGCNMLYCDGRVEPVACPAVSAVGRHSIQPLPHVGAMRCRRKGMRRCDPCAWDCGMCPGRNHRSQDTTLSAASL